MGAGVVRVALTGADGYIGSRMGHVLLEGGHDVVGFDSGLHRVSSLYHSRDRRPPVIDIDMRDVEVDHLRGFDAVVHLAEISNDPVGELNPSVTDHVNHQGTVRLAENARSAGVRRFVHMSSCSVYGASGEVDSSETSPTDPLTAYARAKLQVEIEVGAMAGDDFCPTFLRNATAFGASPNQRFDLVVNDLTALAFLTSQISMTSDGTPWRPFVHLLDIAKATRCVLDADEAIVNGQVLNCGSDDQNLQVRQVAELVAERVPGCELEFGPPGADSRDYRADFTKIHELLPDFSCDWTVAAGIEELLTVLRRIDLQQDGKTSRGRVRFTQIRHLMATDQVDDMLRWRW
jgi:nucleoside-diphosphate-sugar epimerase